MFKTLNQYVNITLTIILNAVKCHNRNQLIGVQPTNCFAAISITLKTVLFLVAARVEKIQACQYIILKIH